MVLSLKNDTHSCSSYRNRPSHHDGRPETNLRGQNPNMRYFSGLRGMRWSLIAAWYMKDAMMTEFFFMSSGTSVS